MFRGVLGIWANLIIKGPMKWLWDYILCILAWLQINKWKWLFYHILLIYALLRMTVTQGNNVWRKTSLSDVITFKLTIPAITWGGGVCLGPHGLDPYHYRQYNKHSSTNMNFHKSPVKFCLSILFFMWNPSNNSWKGLKGSVDGSVCKTPREERDFAMIILGK